MSLPTSRLCWRALRRFAQATSLPELRRAVSHIHAYLQEGGCLVVSRNDDQPDSEVENGSVWLREGSRFRWLQDFGAGSEIRSVVDDWSQS